MPAHLVSLDTLYARYDALAEGCLQGDSRPAHAAILARLGENRRLAEASGWTACALDRLGGGHLQLTGVARAGVGRAVIPDLARGGARLDGQTVEVHTR